MRIFQDQVGSWTVVPVHAISHDRAVAEAKTQARREGHRVIEVGQAVRQSDSRLWHVHLGVRSEREEGRQ